MVSSHGTIQGYNGQAFVDSKHQVIIHGEAFGTGQDHHLIPPMLDGAKENIKAIGPNGKVLKLKVKNLEAPGVFYRRHAADEKNCTACKLKARCLKKGNVRRRVLSVPIASAIGNLTKIMEAKVGSEEGRKIYPQRLAIVEPVFANITTHKRMDRFTLRRKIKVDIQWMLYCMVYNIEKILNYCPNYGVT